MAMYKNWDPTATVLFETVSDSEFSEMIADLGQLIYDSLCSRQLLDDASIAPSPVEIVSYKRERAVANE